MSAKSNQISSKTFRGTLGERALWVGVALVLVAALAITAATQFGPTRKITQPVVAAQSVPDAASQSVADYLRAHGVGLTAADQTVLDANTQSVLEYLEAHRVADGQQTVPDAATTGVLEYLRAHGVYIK